MPILEVVNPKNTVVTSWRSVFGALAVRSLILPRQRNENPKMTLLRSCVLRHGRRITALAYCQKTHLTQRAAHHASNSAAA
ncbi:hypothetical protein PD5205_01025 [Xanthomonas fragariae]|uniref:Uncharacterized protein n=1 Tax=Xanthomonas fragariae TaxID=48664 RepID=A0A1Y6GYG8_9XANT|nr:hypothetical protein NBC2815_02983 [Xanthomonas fragariae]SMR00210.1 hypothetical protein PD885_02988 [Xanthomonas fragariae]SMR02344.1 hypothetical protein PD5205_01025 [Xanthomonas fragariae]